MDYWTSKNRYHFKVKTPQVKQTATMETSVVPAEASFNIKLLFRY